MVPPIILDSPQKAPTAPREQTQTSATDASRRGTWGEPTGFEALLDAVTLRVDAARAVLSPEATDALTRAIVEDVANFVLDWVEGAASADVE